MFNRERKYGKMLKKVIVSMSIDIEPIKELFVIRPRHCVRFCMLGDLHGTKRSMLNVHFVQPSVAC